MIAYLRDPQAIYARSFEIIRAEADFSHLPPDAEAIATRIIHACGMPEIAADLRISADFVAAATAAIAAGKPVLVDAEMVRHGIIDKSLNVICTLNDPAGAAHRHRDRQRRARPRRSISGGRISTAPSS